MKAPAPRREDTGSIIPEYWVAGMSVRSAVPNIAATWLDMNVDMRMPIDVAIVT